MGLCPRPRRAEPQHGIHAGVVMVIDWMSTSRCAAVRTTKSSLSEMNALTELGMLKMDFLGLKTLTVLEETVQRIEKRIQVRPRAIPIDDKAAFDVYNRGETLEFSRWRAWVSPVAADASMCGALRTSLPSELFIDRGR